MWTQQEKGSSTEKYMTGDFIDKKKTIFALWPIHHAHIYVQNLPKEKNVGIWKRIRSNRDARDVIC